MARKRYFAWSPIRALMSTVGAKIVARDAVDFLIEYLQEHTVDLTKRSITLAKHAGRKKVTTSDIQLAIKGF
ncbi:MAG: histone [Promethearchaeota archaeon]|nr:MAG: histone [Candidatus Lokiarchaeota archaeon]